MKKKRYRHLLKSETGASLTEMAIIVALVALVGIPAVTALGNASAYAICKARTKPGDLNNDNIVNIFDMAMVGANYGKTGTAYIHVDANCDGIINIDDMAFIGERYNS